MTPFKRWLVKTAEKWLGRYYEGPEPPTYIRDVVQQFVQNAPRATRDEWVAFAQDLAGEAYMAGYTRGYEYVERTTDWKPNVPPEELADLFDPAWKNDGRGIDPNDVGSFVSDEPQAGELEDVMQNQVEDVLIAGAREQ
jgi:ABC-type Fe3+ transport system substrate-binding protein